MRIGAVVGSAVMTILASASVAAAASMPTGGAIRLFVTPSLSGSGGTIIVAGAIGDYGKVSPVTKKGLGEAILKKGTFEVNLANMQKKLNSAAPILENKATCSFVFGATAPVTIMKGTGLYKGISGTIMLTETFAGIGPLYKTGAKKGQCNTGNNVNPVAQWGSVTGTGTVKFT